MNKDDRENLKFIIIQSQAGALDEWLDGLEVDELQYALELLKQYHTARTAMFKVLVDD